MDNLLLSEQTPNKMRYSRFLEPRELLSRALSDEVFVALREAVKSGLGAISLLEGNRVQLNYGTTRLAVLRFKNNESQLVFFRPKESKIIPSLSDLAALAKEVKPSYMVEGKWQDQLCRCGFLDVPSTSRRWLVIDREAVIGFPSATEKKAFWSSVRSDLEGHTEAFRQLHLNWCHFKVPGDECDLLALSDKCELACWEVKDGSNGALEWAPFQAWAYRKAFEKAAPYISNGIKEMVRQKVALGLLKEEVCDFLPEGDFRTIDAAVVVGNPKASRQKTDRLNESWKGVVPSVRVLEVVKSSNQLAELF